MPAFVTAIQPYPGLRVNGKINAGDPGRGRRLVRPRVSPIFAYTSFAAASVRAPLIMIRSAPRADREPRADASDAARTVKCKSIDAATDNTLTPGAISDPLSIRLFAIGSKLTFPKASGGSGRSKVGDDQKAEFAAAANGSNPEHSDLRRAAYRHHLDPRTRHIRSSFLSSVLKSRAQKGRK